jgi:3-isopropylmalate/(R)-2-methylmalate dehydratase small subunit
MFHLPWRLKHFEAETRNAGQVTNETTGAAAQAQPLSDYVLKILESGGIKPMIKSQYGSKG